MEGNPEFNPVNIACVVVPAILLLVTGLGTLFFRVARKFSSASPPEDTLSTYHEPFRPSRPEPTTARVIPSQPTPVAPIEQPRPTVRPRPVYYETLRGAGSAAAAPPNFERVIQEIRKIEKSYALPIGWKVEEGNIALETLSLKNEVNHILITGQNESGKDNAVRVALLSLAMQHNPDELQFALIDGKGLDWSPWKDKDHTWLLAKLPEELPDAVKRLTSERVRRIRILEEAGVTKWQDYTGGDLPMLVVFISELKLINLALGRDFESWLAGELSVARATGMRYILGTQTATRMGTDWRSQVALFIAGFQPARSQDEPNANLTGEDIKNAGAVPPSELPPPPAGSGAFCVVHGRNVRNVRQTFLSGEEITRYMRILPDKGGPLVLYDDLFPEGMPTDTESNLFSYETATKNSSDDRIMQEVASVSIDSWSSDDMKIRGWMAERRSVRWMARELYPKSKDGGGGYSDLVKKRIERIKASLGVSYAPPSEE